MNLIATGKKLLRSHERYHEFVRGNVDEIKYGTLYIQIGMQIFSGKR